MGLDDILLKTVFSPIYYGDKAVKFAHDVVVDYTGRDRYALGRFMAYMPAVAGLGYTILTNVPEIEPDKGGFMPLILGAALTWLTRDTVNHAEKYFKQPKDVLDAKDHFFYTYTAKIGRSVGFPATGAAVWYGLAAAAGTIWDNWAEPAILWSQFLTVSSAYYFMDGEHAMWHKAKETAKAGWNKFLKMPVPGVKKNPKPQAEPIPTPIPKPIPQPNNISLEHFVETKKLHEMLNYQV